MFAVGEYGLFCVSGTYFLSRRVTSKCVASIGCRTRDKSREDTKHQEHYQRSNYDQPGLRMTKIHGPSQAETLWDKQIRIVGIVVKDTSIPVLIIIAENSVVTLTISGCTRFCPGTLRMPEQDEDEDNQ